MNRLLPLLIISCLAGCTTPAAKPGELVSVSCHGNEWASCFGQAQRLCGNAGFELINQITDAGSTATSLDESLTQGAQVQRSLLARCNGTPP